MEFLKHEVRSLYNIRPTLLDGDPASSYVHLVTDWIVRSQCLNFSRDMVQSVIIPIIVYAVLCNVSLRGH